ncbi:CNP1-like family protein [uncultured Thiodictyon sp.]|uniref:CNP1-like family protein n=1 Tax=uncultured Thiodictyon sp. TaxID=1846217 RepID=UPI0025F1388D|nr:CNP1-like family protein [uncultured Thiodictyon sp.]
MISNSTASSIPLPLLLALFLGCPPALAENNFTLDPESRHIQELPEPVAKPEMAAPLPPWPRDADLIAYTPDGPPTPFRFYIDGKNLTTDARHEEVHYTLILESKTGTRNVSFEGIRCTLKGEYKVFAYGTNGHFARAPGDEWQPITALGNESYRDDLWRNRFCIARETRGRALPDILRALKGRVSATDSTGFQAQ